jgi:hypothetical protein
MPKMAEPRRTPKKDQQLAEKWNEAVLMHEPLRPWIEESKWAKKKVYDKS